MNAALKTKLPQGTNGIAKLLGMTPDEFRACKYYEEVRTLFSDYNLGYIRRSVLVEKLTEIKERPEVYFKDALEHAITKIKSCY